MSLGPVVVAMIRSGSLPPRKEALAAERAPVANGRGTSLAAVPSESPTVLPMLSGSFFSRTSRTFVGRSGKMLPDPGFPENGDVAPELATASMPRSVFTTWPL